jgi:hypothetical protein
MSDYIKDTSIPKYIILYQDTDPDDYSPVWSTQSEHSLSVEEAGTHLTGASEDEEEKDEDITPPLQKKIKIEGDPHSCYYCWRELSDRHSAHCWLTSTEYNLYSTDEEISTTSTNPNVYYSSLSFGGAGLDTYYSSKQYAVLINPTIDVYSACNPFPGTICGILRNTKTRSSSTVVSGVSEGDVYFEGRPLDISTRVTRSHTRATGATATVESYNRDWSTVVVDKPRKNYSTANDRIAGTYKGAYSGVTVVPLYTKSKSLVVNQVLGHVAFGNKVYYYYEDHEEPTNTYIVPPYLFLWVRQCTSFKKLVGKPRNRSNRIFRNYITVNTPETHEANQDIRASRQVTHLYWDDEEALKLYQYSYYQPAPIYERASIFSNNFSGKDIELYVSPGYYNKHHTESWMRMGPDDWKYRATEEDHMKRRQWIYNKLLE